MSHAAIERAFERAMDRMQTELPGAWPENEGWRERATTMPDEFEMLRRVFRIIVEETVAQAANAAYPDPIYMGGNDRDENGNLPPGSPYDRGRYNAAKSVRGLLA